MSIGTDLRQARERAQLSAEQIAERIKVSIQKIEALERADLQLLPHGIYLEGIVRAYAREVAIDQNLSFNTSARQESLTTRTSVLSRHFHRKGPYRRAEGAPLGPSDIEIRSSDDQHEAQPPFLVPTPEDMTIAPVRPAYEHRAAGFTAVGLWVVLLRRLYGAAIASVAR